VKSVSSFAEMTQNGSSRSVDFWVYYSDMRFFRRIFGGEKFGGEFGYRRGLRGLAGSNAKSLSERWWRQSHTTDAQRRQLSSRAADTISQYHSFGLCFAFRPQPAVNVNCQRSQSSAVIYGQRSTLYRSILSVCPRFFRVPIPSQHHQCHPLSSVACVGYCTYKFVRSQSLGCQFSVTIFYFSLLILRPVHEKIQRIRQCSKYLL